jgi:hypothetical protein
VAALLGRPAREWSWENKGILWSKIAHAVGGAIVSAGIIVLGALLHLWILERPLPASIGEPATVLVLITGLVVGAWLVCAMRPGNGHYAKMLCPAESKILR